MHQRTLVLLEVAQQPTDVPLETPDARHVAHMLAPRPAAQGRELALASRPGTVPQAPFRTLQSANRLVGQGRVGRASAKATGRLQRVLEAHCGVPPVEHDCGLRQRLVLQPPQPPASPSHSTAAGVSACTPAVASACLNASVLGDIREAGQ